MKKSKSTIEVIEEFIDTMEKVTGKGVTVDYDPSGNITITYEEYPASILMGHNNSNKSYDLDSLLYPDGIEYRNNEKLLNMSDYNPKKLRKN